jgi:short-subunit dehydrogenase
VAQLKQKFAITYRVKEKYRMNYRQWLAAEFDKSKDSVLITGATEGIGLEYLHLLSAEKCHCIIISNEEIKLKKVADEIQSTYGTRIDTINCDLSNFDDITALEKKLAKYRIKFLINNAGMGLNGDFLSHSKENYRDLLAVNTLAPTLISHMVLPGMRAMNSGVHLLVSSINVASPIPASAVYTASKTYAWAYAMALPEENRNYNIVFQVCLPGTTDTSFHTKQGNRPTHMVMLPRNVALRSLNDLDRREHLPNRIDRLIYPIASRVPIVLRMRMAHWILKKRLGLTFSDSAPKS